MLTIPPCPRCGEPRKKDSRNYTICVPCNSARAKAKRHNNPEAHKLQRQTYLLKNEAKVLQKRKEYNEKNRDRKAVYFKEYYTKNHQSLLEKGRERNRNSHPLYKVWAAMKSRCFNVNNAAYYRYGGRGITVCARWRSSFQNFLMDMGERPGPDYSIERKDTNGNYEPNNCVWATREEQANNIRTNVSRKTSIPESSPVQYQGKWMTLSEFSNETGLHLTAAKYRYAYSMNPDYLLSNEYDNRFYEYQGHRYNIAELSLIAQIPYKTIHARLIKMNWSVIRTLSEPVNRIEPKQGYR